MNEEWRVADRFQDYEVSSLGRARRRTPYNSTIAGRVLKPFPNRDGHLLLKLRGGNVAVHRLVCEAFHGPPPSPRYEVAHNDGCPTNNAADNLRWATRRDNARDAIAHGTTLRGSKNCNSVLREHQVRQIKRLIRTGQKCAAIAETYGVSRSAITSIRDNKTWRHIP